MRGRRRTALLQLTGVVALVVAVHVGAPLARGEDVRAGALLGSALGAVLVWSVASAVDLSRRAAALSAVLALSSPVALAAFSDPGAAAAVLLLAPAVGLLVAALGLLVARRSGRGAAAHGTVWIAAALALGPLLVLLLATPAGGGGAGAGGHSGVAALRSWASLDPVLPVLVVLCSCAALALPRARLLGGAALTALLLVAAVHLNDAAVVAAQPAACLAVAAVVDAAWQRVTGTSSARRGSHRARAAPVSPAVRHRTALGAVAVAVAVAAVAPAWAASVRRMPSASGSSAVTQATRWLQDVPASQRVAVDAVLYRRLAADGDTTSAIVPISGGDGTPTDGRSTEWVLSTPELRAVAAQGTWAHQALAGSRPVEVFGQGSTRIEVRRLSSDLTAAPDLTTTPSPTSPPTATPTQTQTPQPTPGQTPAGGTDSSPAPAASSPPVTPTSTPPGASTAPALARTALASNPALALSDPAREQLQDGVLDDRLVALLAQLVSERPMSVSDLPAVPTDAPGTPRRVVVVDGMNGQPLPGQSGAVAALREELAAQDPLYRPRTSLSDGGTTLTIQLPAPA